MLYLHIPLHTFALLCYRQKFYFFNCSQHKKTVTFDPIRCMIELTECDLKKRLDFGIPEHYFYRNMTNRSQQLFILRLKEVLMYGTSLKTAL